MELKQGYTQTEAGIIPVDWKCRGLGDIANVSAGGTPSRAVGRYWNGGIPWVTTSELDFQTITTAEQSISAEGLANSAAKLLPAGTILMALYGQGKTRGKVGVLGMRAATNQACAAIVLKPGVDAAFVFRYLASRYRDIRNLSNTGNQENLNGSIVRSIPIPLPPASEQAAIAGALSDVDGLIGALDRLIAKKHDLKQAAMRQLLTGRTRLPGFKGKWKLTRLRDHVRFLSHATHARAVLLTEGSVRYLHYGDVHAAPSIWLDPRTTPMPFVADRLAARFDRIESGDLVIVDASEDLTGIGKSVELRGVEGMEIIAGLHTITARFDKSAFADGFKGYLQFMPSFKNQLERLAAGTKVYASSKSHVSSVEIELPGVEEQAAIAEALHDMATEIAALESRRAKTRVLKQGMMQELLTGRVRPTSLK